MHCNSSLRVNTPTVSHETIDGEAVIVNLDSGNYYSLAEAGSAIWRLIVARQSVDGIYKYICETYTGERSEIENGINELLSQLQQEDLVVSTESIECPSIASGDGITLRIDRIPFQRPVLQKFTDMQELLLLDPIHDVDDTGWPRKPE